MNTKLVITAILLALFIELPISLYLFYWVLTQLHPDRLIWFLFIIYIPVVILTSILAKVISGDRD